ncbi:MAG: glycoside hydrolase family 3 protein, partial [Treponema sp.]|nr:glycoside hydrolase family 3 protein [Treponema sp.]
ACRLAFDNLRSGFHNVPHKVTALLLAASLCALSSCSSKQRGTEEKTRQAGRAVQKEALLLEEKKSAALDKYIQSLTERERLAQLFVINLEGDKKFWFVERVDDPDKKGQPLIPGGYIFFSFNIARDPAQIAAFTDSVRDFARSNNAAEPFLCLDAEGGYVNRLRGVAGPLPENEWVSSNLSPKEAFLLYSLNAIQLRSLGFDLNLSPVVEVQNERNQEFLDGRSFGGAQEVEEYASAALVAYQTNKVAAVLKHFPGNNSVDPHAALPILSFDSDEFERDVLEPFKLLVKEKPAGVLMSHALVNVNGLGQDSSQGQAASQGQKTPASLSSYWIKKILRERIGFAGLVFSDDIFMAALEKNGWPSERAVKSAILAGVNCILMSEKRFVNEWRLVKKLYDSDQDFRAAADDSIKKVFAFKLEAGILEWDFATETVRPCASRPSIDERLERFYGAKILNQEILEKYGQK